MRIFLIAGKAGSGKNVVAKLIKEYYIYKVEECAITSYSKYIKNFALELTDWDGTDANKPRDFMQHLGDVMREVDENFLVSNMIKDITIYQKYVENLVISDVRMPNEIDKIKVKLYGTENNLNEINDVNSYIDLKEYGIAGIYEVPLKLNVDENIYDYILEPSKVQIKIS